MSFPVTPNKQILPWNAFMQKVDGNNMTYVSLSGS